MADRYLTGLGLNTSQAATLVQAFNGVRRPAEGEYSSYVQMLQIGIGGVQEGYDYMEDIVEEGKIKGAIPDNLAYVDEARLELDDLQAKLGKLTEAQAREAFGYLIGLWAGIAVARGAEDDDDLGPR